MAPGIEKSELHTLRTIKTCHKIPGQVQEAAVEMVLEAEGGTSGHPSLWQSN